METFLSYTLFGNPVKLYVIALGTLLGSWIVLSLSLRGLAYHLHKVAKKTKTQWDDFLIAQIKTVPQFVFFMVSLYIGSLLIRMPENVSQIITFVCVFAITISTTRFILSLITHVVETYYIKDGDDPATRASTHTMMTIFKYSLWMGVALFLMDNLGLNISALIAGLGIGGIAVALAAQAVLGDLFSSFSIFLDKPFQVGDFIIIDGFMGTVEHIGIKTTRLRSLSGEQLVFSNTDLTKSRVRNYKRMNTRRVLFTIGVTYDTPVDTLKRIPEIVTRIISEVPKITLDRVHMKSFGPSSIDFEIVYHVSSREYSIYMDIQQQINFALKAQFDDQKIEFAFPTQTIYLHQPSQEPSTNVPS